MKKIWIGMMILLLCVACQSSSSDEQFQDYYQIKEQLITQHDFDKDYPFCVRVVFNRIEDVYRYDLIIDQDYQCQSAHLKILSVNGNESEIEVEIYEGKFHQIKKMFHAVGKEVTYLKRIRMKNLVLDESLELGSYRELTDEELDRLKSETVLQ